MIKKSIAFALLFIVCYALLFHFSPVKTTQDMQHTNIARAQTYSYSNIQDSIVIVGSSMSERIIEDSLNNVSSLSFSGMSVFDGLKVVEKAKKVPRVILIETNVLEKSENKDFTAYFTNPVLFNLYRLIPSLRADARPIGYIIKIVNYPINRLFPDDHCKVGPKSELTNKLLQNQQKEYSNLSDTLKIKANVIELKKLLLKFEALGCKICFFEMPVDGSLRNLARANYIRNTLFNTFAKNRYHYLLFPNKHYDSVDGIHLTPKAAKDFTSIFRKQIQKLNYEK